MVEPFARVHLVHLMNAESVGVQAKVASDAGLPKQAAIVSASIHHHHLLLLSPKADIHITVSEKVEG